MGVYLFDCVIFGYSYNIVHYLYYNVPVPAGERCLALSTNKWYQQLAHQILIGLLLSTRSNASNESWSIELKTFVYRKTVYSWDIGSDNWGGTALAGQCPHYVKIKKCGRTYCSWRLRSAYSTSLLGRWSSYSLLAIDLAIDVAMDGTILCRWSEGFAHAIPIEITINLEVPRVVLRGWGGWVDLYSYRSSNKPESVEHQADAYRLLFGNYCRTAIHVHNVYVLWKL